MAVSLSSIVCTSSFLVFSLVEFAGVVFLGLISFEMEIQLVELLFELLVLAELRPIGLDFLIND